MFLNNLFFRALFGYEKQTNDLTLVGLYLKQLIKFAVNRYD